MRDEFAEIEGHEFSARVNVASDFKTFLRAVSQEQAARRLVEHLADPETQMAVLSRVFELTSVRIDPRYQHPWDTPLAVYLWALSLTSQVFAGLAAVIVFEAPQTWFARRMARYGMLNEQVRNASGSTEHVVVQSTFDARSTVESPASGDALTPMGILMVTVALLVWMHFHTKHLASVKEPRRVVGSFQKYLEFPGIASPFAEFEVSASTTETQVALAA
jgi:hypothetical protein